MNRQPLWRSTPPAIFPVILGLIGLALVWRGFGLQFGLLTALGDILMGIAAALLAFFMLSYFAKLFARPGTLMNDLKSPPGRAGVSAISTALIVLSVGLLPYGEIAGYIWWAGVVLHVIIVLFVLKSLAKSQPTGRSVTPFLYLPFVGLITAPLAGIPLGYMILSQTFSYISLVAFLAITARLIGKFIRTRPPAPLRPPYAIILAMFSLFGLAFGQFGPETGFAMFYFLAWGAALALLVFATWLTTAGFTPMWGELTFPVTTFPLINIVAINKGYGVIATTGLISGALIATALVIFVAYNALKMWAKRDLAKKTGAAVA